MNQTSLKSKVPACAVPSILTHGLSVGWGNSEEAFATLQCGTVSQLLQLVPDNRPSGFLRREIVSQTLHSERSNNTLAYDWKFYPGNSRKLSLSPDNHIYLSKFLQHYNEITESVLVIDKLKRGSL